jgi:3-hydroxyisobutyrate dehydrogenase-like beta-hydroxyacid dehydrogenase
MARRLARRRPSPDRLQSAIVEGGGARRSGREAGSHAARGRGGNDVIITMVSDSAAVGNVVLGPDGAVHGTKVGTVIVDMSTINPGSARRIGVALRGRGVGFLDAPVTGMEFRAKDGTLSILVGGDKGDLEKVLDVLSVLGNRITHLGPQGAGRRRRPATRSSAR